MSEYVGVKENGVKMYVVQKYSPTCPRTKLQRRHL
jgi:hypothetical protein